MVKIVTDSTSDLPLDYASRLSIGIIPFKVSFGERTFIDGADLNHQQFIEYLKKHKCLPSTTMATPVDYQLAFSRFLEECDEDIIYLSISSALSGSYQSALTAQKLINDPRLIVEDGQSISMGLGLKAIGAARLAQEGCSKEEILRKVKGWRHVHAYIAVNDLSYLHRGGRVKANERVLAGILNIKPIISMKEKGELFLWDKVRGFRRSMRMIVDKVESFGLDLRKRTVAIGYSAEEELALEMKALLSERMDLGEVIIFSPGSAVCSHLGPGAVAVFFLAASPPGSRNPARM
ncbi:MAG: DegV family protein [Clostridiales bacterium]|nr:DegV family protein [Clostridiales bacterium]